MKIVHLCLGNFYMDGASYQENILTKYHEKMGYDVTIIAGLSSYGKDGNGIILDGPKTYQVTSGIKIVRLDYAKPFKYGHFCMKYKGLYDVLLSEKPDIIFCHNLQFGDTGIVARYLKNNTSVRLFADNHGDYVNSARNWISRVFKHKLMWKHYVKKLEPYLVKVYGVTPMRCRFLKEMYGIKPSLIDFLPMGVDDESIPTDRVNVRTTIRQELGIKEDDIMVMTGGKIELRKNTHYLNQAISAIDNNRIHLVVCGTFTPEVIDLEKLMRLNPQIHLLGWCDAERVMNVMVSSDFVCFPGTHSTLWEQAVGLGKPAIFKYWKDIDHVNINGNCIFVKGDDVEEIVNAIHTLSTPIEYQKYKSLAEEASASFLYSDIAKRSIESI